VFRGGSWVDLASNCTVSLRVSYIATYTLSSLGFRVIRVSL